LHHRDGIGWERRRSHSLPNELALEEKAGERIVCQNEDFVALVPFWAAWPFEVMVLFRRNLGALNELSARETIGWRISSLNRLSATIICSKCRLPAASLTGRCELFAQHRSVAATVEDRLKKRIGPFSGLAKKE
jgi:Galactose-1-phosphate uridyl transferase, C-terminal domain